MKIGLLARTVVQSSLYLLRGEQGHSVPKSTFSIPVKKINTFLNAIQAVMAALVHRLEATTGFFDGRIIQLEIIIPERSHRSEERQELYIRMLNKLKQNINIRFTDI